MKRTIDRLLRKYDGPDWLLQRKARTLLALNMVLILIILIDAVVSSFLLGKIAPESIPNFIIVFGLLFNLALLMRGRYHASAVLGIVIVFAGISWTRFVSTGTYSLDASYDSLQYVLDLVIVIFYANLIAQRKRIIVATFVCSIIFLALYNYALPNLFHNSISPATVSVFIGGFLFLIIAGFISLFTFIQNQRAIDIAVQESKTSKESERNYREIFNSTNEAIFIHEAVTGQILDVNDAVLKMYGFETKEQALTKTIGDLSANVPPYTNKESHQNLLNAQTLGPQTFDWLAIKVTGEQFWVAVSLHKTEIGGQGRILAVVRDINERKRSEEALRESEERFSVLSEAAFEGIVITDEDRIIDVNKQITAMYGYERSEMIGLAVEKFVAPQSLDLVMKHIRSGNEDPYEHLSLRKDGSIFPVEIRARSLHYKDRAVRVTVIRDITEWKNAEEQLELLKHSIDVHYDGAYWMDNNNKFVYVNDTGCKVLGYAREELIGMDVNEINPRANAKVMNSVWENLRKERFRTSESVHRRKDGGEFPVEIVSSYVHFGGKEYNCGFARDITERKRAEMELKRSEEKYRGIFENVLDVFYESTTDGTILDISPSITLASKGQYNREELIGKSILDFYNNGGERKTFLSKLRDQGSVTDYEVTLKNRDGSLILCSISSKVRLNEQGLPEKIVGSIRDITERKKAEEKEKNLENLLQQAQKLESVGTLASGIAHDFNNILGIILGHSTLLQVLTKDSQKLSQNVDAITKATQRGASLVKQLLTFARKTESLFETVNINEMIREINKLLHETIHKTIVISTTLQQNLPSIVADANQMHQVLLNLCVNARDAMPNGGTMSILTSVVEGESMRVRFPKITARQYIKIDVVDTGTGMDEATRRRIFEPFFTTKGPGKGTGLGLAVVFGIVEHHNGFIDVQSVPGEGTSFTVYLPIPERALEELENPQNDHKEISGGTETILVIEDEELLRELVKATLVSKGYAVLTAEDGAQGVEMYRSHQDTIALVLSDLGLPKLDGQEVFRKIRKMNPKVKVIIASGFIEPDMKSEMYKTGLNNFIQKPYSFNEVLEKIREAIDTNE